MNYRRIYFNLIKDRLKKNISGYVEKHHIIPKSLGGKDISKNIVSLSARDHFIAHYLLSKMFSNKVKKAKMIMAFGMMMVKTQSQTRYRFTSHQFNILRELRSESMKFLQKGVRNSQFQKIWITNGIFNKKIKLTDTIEEGWRKGRYSNFLIEEKKRIKSEKIKLYYKNKEDKKQKNEEYYTKLYEIYCNDGWKELKKIYNYSKPNFIQQCEKYVKTFKPQNGKIRGK